MTIALAITGKSGSGKTTFVRSFFNILHENYPDKSILLFDNDLSGELGHSYGLDVRNTIYGIRAGKHEYKTGIPAQMTRQEYIEWALQDIIVNIKDETDLIVSWLVGSKDCKCPITFQLDDALVKLIKSYDIVIFDCEYDLKYLHQLVDYPIDVTIIVAEPKVESVYLASRIMESSEKHAIGGQLGVILNKVKGGEFSEEIPEILNEYGLETLGAFPYIEELAKGGIKTESKELNDSVRELLFRLNLPQI